MPVESKGSVTLSSLYKIEVRAIQQKVAKNSLGSIEDISLGSILLQKWATLMLSSDTKQ